MAQYLVNAPINELSSKLLRIYNCPKRKSGSQVDLWKTC
jgi:hypothetical protein